MNPLRKELEDELKRTRLDKTRLYEFLIRLVDGGVGGSGEAGPAGPAGPAGSAPVTKSSVAKKPAAKKTDA